MKKLLILLSLVSAMSTIYSAAAVDPVDKGVNQVDLGKGNIIPLEGEGIRDNLDGLLISLPTSGAGWQIIEKPTQQTPVQLSSGHSRFRFW